jgi:hypothetical protein
MTQAAAITVSSKAHVFSALNNAPMTPAHYLYWLLASGATFLDGVSVVPLGIALPLLKRDFAITPALLGFLGSALVLGAVLEEAVRGSGAGASHQLQCPHGRVPVLADDDVIVHRNAEGLRALHDRLRHLNLGLRRRLIARWVIVHQDNRGSENLERAFDHFARIGQGVIDLAGLLHFVSNQLFALVEKEKCRIPPSRRKPARLRQ